METIHLKKNIEPELTVGKWFRNVYDAVRTTAIGMGITFKYVWGRDVVTIEYPEVREELPSNSRSRLYNDAENCISCLQCAVSCPVDCIYIAAVKRPTDAPKIIKVPAGEIYMRTECPRGELGYHLISDGGKTPYRLKVKSSCFTHVSMLPIIAPGQMVADLVASIGSIDIVLGEVDR